MDKTGQRVQVYLLKQLRGAGQEYCALAEPVAIPVAREAMPVVVFVCEVYGYHERQRESCFRSGQTAGACTDAPRLLGNLAFCLF